jgi:hypothetical protein
MNTNVRSSFQITTKRQQRNLTTLAVALFSLLLAFPAVAGIPKENGTYRVLPASEPIA